jgi:hypothetical protein
MVSFKSRPPYLRRNSPEYSMDRRMGEPQCRSGRGGEEKNPFSVPAGKRNQPVALATPAPNGPYPELIPTIPHLQTLFL